MKVEIFLYQFTTKILFFCSISLQNNPNVKGDKKYL